jgi:hypothetical protein
MTNVVAEVPDTGAAVTTAHGPRWSIVICAVGSRARLAELRRIRHDAVTFAASVLILLLFTAPVLGEGAAACR